MEVLTRTVDHRACLRGSADGPAGKLDEGIETKGRNRMLQGFIRSSCINGVSCSEMHKTGRRRRTGLCLPLFVSVL